MKNPFIDDDINKKIIYKIDNVGNSKIISIAINIFGSDSDEVIGKSSNEIRDSLKKLIYEESPYTDNFIDLFQI